MRDFPYNGFIIPKETAMNKTPVQPERWNARWIWDAGVPRAVPAGHELRYFRRVFEAAAGARALVHVSADSRYQLYLNGVRVSVGPCKGDAWRKYYETVDLSAHLRPGRNVLAARVLHFAPAEPPVMAALGVASVCRTPTGGFLLQGGVENGETLDSDERWTVLADTAVSFHSLATPQFTGETELVNGGAYPHGWETLDFDAAAWAPAVPFWDAMDPSRVLNMEFVGPWSLTPRVIPPMFEEAKTLPYPDASATPHPREAGPASEGADIWVTIPAHTTWTADLDAGELTTAYVSLHTRAGVGSAIRLTYAEAYGEGEEGNAWVKKSIRDDPSTGGIYGLWDEYRPGGGDETYEPFWFRTFRFIRLHVTTGDAPLELFAPRIIETGYPLDVRSAFQASEPRFAALWDISVRTLRRCMHETYEDCPYYEQLQYTLDTRLEALYSSYLSADDRLMRKAIEDFHSAWHPSGLLQARAPGVWPQIIPGFALYWVLMLHDHWRLFGDPGPARRYRSTMDSVLDWFDRQLTADGIVGGFNYWPYFDWVKGWNHGCPPGAPERPATVFSLLYAMALSRAAELAVPAGYPHREAEYRERAAAVNAGVNKTCWDADRGLYRHGPETPGFSTHAQAFAILSGAAPRDQRAAMAAACLEDTSLDPMNWAMQFFLFRALKEVGMYDRAFALFKGWQGLADLNVTTWPEDPVHGRSDCHAWGSVPVYEFLAEILGVQPARPGFAAVRVAPQPGPLEWADGTVITPRGPVRVSWRRSDGPFSIEVTAPPGVPLTVVTPEGARHEGGGTIRVG
jgi:hypothetical protein